MLETDRAGTGRYLRTAEVDAPDAILPSERAFIVFRSLSMLRCGPAQARLCNLIIAL